MSPCDPGDFFTFGMIVANGLIFVTHVINEWVIEKRDFVMQFIFPFLSLTLP